MAAILAEAGVPDGVVNVLPSRRSGAVVSAMLHDPRVRKLSFTGSTEVGRVLLARGGRPGRQQLDGARRQRAVPRLRRRRPRRRARRRDGREDAQRRRGLHGREPVLRRGRRSPRSSAAGWPSGWPRCGSAPASTSGTQVGPLVNEDAVAKVDELVAGRRRGRRAARHRRHPPGRRRAGTTRRPCSPTCRRRRRSCARRSSARSRRSSTFTDEAEAIRLANDTEFGLVAYLYTGDLARGLRVSEALEAGWSASTAASSPTRPHRSAA